MTKPANLFIVSHRRSGTHLVIDSVLSNFKDYRRKYLVADQLSNRIGSMQLADFSHSLDRGGWIIKSHMHGDVHAFFEGQPEIAAAVENALTESKIIYVCRDGRNALYSLYHYHQSFCPEITEKGLAGFIRMANDYDDSGQHDVNRIRYWRRHVESWLGRGKENFLVVSYEQLEESFEPTMNKIADFLGLQPPRRFKNVFRKQNELIPPSTSLAQKWLRRLNRAYNYYIKRISDTAVGFRLGGSENYKQAFSPEDLAFFEAEAGEVMERIKQL